MLLYPEALPAWLKEEDLDYYVSEFERTGFAGALNWYRTLDKSWELMSPWTGAPLSVPALYLLGERDSFVNYPGSQDMLASLPMFIPRLKETLLLKECGHYIQQERPAETNEALLAFLNELP